MSISFFNFRERNLGRRLEKLETEIDFAEDKERSKSKLKASADDDSSNTEVKRSVRLQVCFDVVCDVVMVLLRW